MSSHLITELAKFADDLVVVGAGRAHRRRDRRLRHVLTGMSSRRASSRTTASAEFASA